MLDLKRSDSKKIVSRGDSAFGKRPLRSNRSVNFFETDQRNTASVRSFNSSEEQLKVDDDLNQEDIND